MAIVKLVCQGCGANLDALDNQRLIQCGYCGTSNQIKRTVHEQPVQPIQPIQFPTPTRIAPKVDKTMRRGVVVFTLSLALLPLVIGGVVAFTVFRTASEAIDQVQAGFDGVRVQHDPAVATPGPSKYRWQSEKPFVADVDGDGSDDLIGIIQTMGGSQELVLTARSGTTGTTLWETSLGSRASIPGQPRLRFEPQTKLVLFAVGASLTAYDANDGSQRWVSNFSDAIDSLAVDGERLWVFTIDERSAAVSPSDGKPITDPDKPSPSARVLRDDEGYELIPELRTLDLKYNQFPELRVEAAFCPEEDLPLHVGRRHAAEHKRCSFAHGLAWGVRAQGTQVPFLLGYDRASKSERWRVQLTRPGTLETIDTGFGQPRAELFGDEAVISFTPPDKSARIQRISLIDGKPRWETKLPGEAGDHVTGITLGKDRVFVSVGGEVHVLDFASGEPKTTLGGW